MDKNYCEIECMGAMPPKKDVRDYKIAATLELPNSFELKLPMAVKNQFAVSSCVAHATASILEYHDNGEHTLSTNFIYGGQKPICNRDGKGMYLRDACKIVQKYGDPLEADCQGNVEVTRCYDVAQAALDNENVMKVAQKFKVEAYVDLKTPEDIKYAIYKYGPVLASMNWYKDISVDGQGVIHSSQTGKYGGHAFVIYGWNEKGFLIQNSWGTWWGNNGRAILPYSFKLKEAKALIDAKNDDIIIPKRNKALDFCYRIINFVLNITSKFDFLIKK
jgi:C1A family cysteine protease